MDAVCVLLQWATAVQRMQQCVTPHAMSTAGLGSAPGSVGDLAAGLLWAVSLYFCSPLQLLLLFLGRIETERPSDWVLRQLGRLTRQP